MAEDVFQILVVDDDPDMREMLQLLVTNMGYNALEAGKAKDALQFIERGKADLVLLDLNMPGASGMDLLTVLQRRRLEVPIIIVSAYVSQDIAGQLAEKGVKGIVAKPFKKDRIEGEIRRVLGQ